MNDLATFQNYKQGWDGENASPLSQENAQINLAEEEFSYFKNDGNQLNGESHVKYSVKSLLKTIRFINK